MRRRHRSGGTAGWLAAACLLAAGGAQAHHSSSMYDTAHPVQLSGRVESFEWQNPHSLLRLQTTDAAGRTVAYEMECASISHLQSHGWPRDIVKAGDRVTVIGALRKDVATRGEVITLILPDGRRMTNQVGR